MILAFDSSASQSSVALIQDGKVIRELEVQTPRSRGGGLFTLLEEILSEAPPLTRVVVGTGPGSYNGIRAALAAGWGIAAIREIPLIGISSLLGLDEGSYCAVGDARRGQYYFARIKDGQFLEEPHLLEKESLLEKLQPFADEPLLVPSALEFLSSALVQMPKAARLGLGANQTPTPGIPEPLYLKPAYINLPGYR